MHKLNKLKRSDPGKGPDSHHLADGRCLIKKKCHIEEVGLGREETLLLQVQKKLLDILVGCITSTCGFLVFRRVLESACQVETTRLLAETRGSPSGFCSAKECLLMIQEAMEVFRAYKSHPEIRSKGADEWKYRLLLTLFFARPINTSSASMIWPRWRHFFGNGRNGADDVGP